MEPGLVEQGLQLMYFGMGTVFVFLTLLVLVTSAMSFLVQRYGSTPAPAANKTVEAGQSGLDAATVAAISAAIHQHRHRDR